MITAIIAICVNDMKRIISIVLMAVMLMGIFAACGAEETPVKEETVKLWYGYNTENFM